MPTDPRTVSPEHIAAQVEAVLGGVAVGDHVELSDAVEAYRTSGQAAHLSFSDSGRASLDMHERYVY